MAWCTQLALTDPSSIPANPPSPRLPRTSIMAPSLSSSSRSAALPSRTINLNPAGRSVPNPWTPLEETVRTLDDFVRAGKISYWGLSNFTGWQLTKIVDTAISLGASRPVT